MLDVGCLGVRSAERERMASGLHAAMAVAGHGRSMIAP